MRVPLELRWSAQTRGTPAAWFLPGATASEWLHELAQFRAPLTGPVLLLVPSSPGDETPCGALVLVETATRPSPRAQPYTRMGRRLYLPANASLAAPLSTDELDALPGHPLVLHPSAGPVAFTRGDAVALRDLLSAPPRGEARWDRARSGPPPLPPLRDVRALRPVTLETILARGRDDIGGSSPSDLPEDPSEQPKGDALRWAGGQLAKAARWLRGEQGDAGEGSEGGAGKGKGSWVDRLEQWSAEKRQQLRDLRSRELERLLKLLEQNPDEGLRYALPLSGTDRSRGTGKPGAKLPPRDMRLNLGAPQGGGAGDSWEIAPDVYQQLRDRYREAVNRELALGRFQRAAYILLELLGDVAMAANVLERGRHYREAALLLRTRLDRPLDAARCLERGGLLSEAAELYLEEQQFERAASLFEKLERRDDARAAYRQQVDKLCVELDVRGAARLLEEKLTAPDEALELLAGTWPTGVQAAGCLDDRFALLGRLERHPHAQRLIRDLIPAPPGRALVVIEALGRVSGGYPQPEACALAADSARVVAGIALEAATPAAAERVVRSLARLDPCDRLLARDARRYVSQARKQRRRPRPGFSLREVAWSRELRLPYEVRWERAVAVDGGFFAVGQHPTAPVVLRARWDGGVQWRHWPKAARCASPLILAAANAFADLPVVVRGASGQLPPLELRATDRFPQAASAGTPSWLPERTVAAATSALGVVWAVYASGSDMLLTCHDVASHGALIYTARLGPCDPSGLLPPVYLLAEGRRVAVAWGQRVELRVGAKLVESIELPHPVTGLCGSFHHECVGASMTSGGVFLWGRHRKVERHAFASGMVAPLTEFTADGRLVALTRHEGRVYSTRSYGLQHLCTFTGPGQDLVALLPVDVGQEEMATLSEDGRVRLFRLPAELA